MNNNNNSVNNMTSNRTIASCVVNGGATHIPLPKTYTTTVKVGCLEKPATNGNNINSVNAERWKIKYEESEKRRKMQLTQSEKLSRELSDLNKKYERVYEHNIKVSKQLQEKHEQLEKLQKASKDFYIVYDTLKNKYDVELDAYRKAMHQSSKWYKENNKLKRKSEVLVQRMLQIKPDESIEELNEGVDSTDDGQSDSEIEELRKTIQDLSEKVARIQAELNSAKLMEFEATEQTVNLNQELDQERRRNAQLQSEITKLRESNEHMNRVSKLVVTEVANLRDSAQRDRDNVIILRHEADTARKERNVLAHQSALLMEEIIPADGDDKCLRLLLEIESLKSALEEEQNKRIQEVADLQEKLEDRESEAQLELLEEKLKLSELELVTALERAERAEQECKTLKAPPLPPPPPPPPMAFAPPINTPIKLKTTTTLNHTNVNNNNESAVEDMEEILGIDSSSNKTSLNVPVAAINDVINQIKGGKFMLKATDKPEQKKPPEEPAAVKEMLNVLGSLRRRPKPLRTFTESSFGDVQL